MPDARSNLVFHVTFASDWAAAQRVREIRVSTRGARFEDVGFIHASFEHQVASIGALVYRNASEPVVVLVIDTDRLTAPVLVEDLRGEGEAYPHIYGPIPTSAVVDVIPATITADGEFVLQAPDDGAEA